jgi:hypothetical protein
MCVDAVKACLDGLVALNDRDQLQVRVNPAGLILDEAPVGSGTVVEQELSRRLHRAGVAALAIDRAATSRDLARFCCDLLAIGQPGSRRARAARRTAQRTRRGQDWRPDGPSARGPAGWRALGVPARPRRVRTASAGGDAAGQRTGDVPLSARQGLGPGGSGDEPLGRVAGRPGRAGRRSRRARGHADAARRRGTARTRGARVRPVTEVQRPGHGLRVAGPRPGAAHVRPARAGGARARRNTAPGPVAPNRPAGPARRAGGRADSARLPGCRAGRLAVPAARAGYGGARGARDGPRPAGAERGAARDGHAPARKPPSAARGRTPRPGRRCAAPRTTPGS